MYGSQASIKNAMIVFKIYQPLNLNTGVNKSRTQARNICPNSADILASFSQGMQVYCKLNDLLCMPSQGLFYVHSI